MAASAAALSRPAPPATSSPKISYSCSRPWACALASTSRNCWRRAKSSRPPSPTKNCMDTYQRQGCRVEQTHESAVLPRAPDDVECAAAAARGNRGARRATASSACGPFRGCSNEPLYPLGTDRALLTRTKAAMAATGVDLLDIEVARIIKEAKPRDYLPALEAAAELGGRHVLSSAWCDDRPYIADFFSELCALAQPFRPDCRPRVRDVVGHSDARRGGRSREGSEATQRGHRHRHAALRPLPRRARETSLAPA